MLLLFDRNVVVEKLQHGCELGPVDRVAFVCVKQLKDLMRREVLPGRKAR